MENQKADPIYREVRMKIEAARNQKLHCILDVMDIRFEPIRRLLTTRQQAIDGFFEGGMEVDQNGTNPYLELFIHCNKQLGDFLGI